MFLTERQLKFMSSKCEMTKLSENLRAPIILTSGSGVLSGFISTSAPPAL